MLPNGYNQLWCDHGLLREGVPGEISLGGLQANATLYHFFLWPQMAPELELVDLK